MTDVLCFGDSNTWGYNPKDGSRFPWGVRWTSVLQAVHGFFKGTLLTVWRLLRCQPLAKFGYDPVPEKGKWVNPNRNLTRSK